MSRAWKIRIAAVAAMSGAALVVPLTSAEAVPDPLPGFPGTDQHDCNGGFIYDPEWFDDGPVTDGLHHYVEPLLRPVTNLIPTPLPAPLGAIEFDPHRLLGCGILYKLGL